MSSDKKEIKVISCEANTTTTMSSAPTWLGAQVHFYTNDIVNNPVSTFNRPLFFLEVIYLVDRNYPC